MFNQLLAKAVQSRHRLRLLVYRERHEKGIDHRQLRHARSQGRLEILHLARGRM